MTGNTTNRFTHRLFTYSGSMSDGEIRSTSLGPPGAFYHTPTYIERIIMLGMRYYPDQVIIHYGGGQRSLSHKLIQSSMTLIIKKPGVKINTDFRITIS